MMKNMKKLKALSLVALLWPLSLAAQDFADIVNNAEDEMLAEDTSDFGDETVTEQIAEFSSENQPAETLPTAETEDKSSTSEEPKATAPAKQIVQIDDDEEDTAVDASASLTENLNKSGSVDDILPTSSSDNSPNQNWVDKLISSGKSKKNGEKEGSLSEMLETSRAAIARTRSNASVFDISGVMLRMNLLQAEEALRKRGYKKVSQKMEIPNFIKWRNEELCRGSGVVGYERLANCVVQKAKKENYEYVETAKYAKYDTKESMEIKLTSTFTQNKIYKISYKSEAALVRGSSQKSAYLRNIKVFDFWKKVNQKYGAPDNRDDVIWGMGGNKPYMQGATGMLVLEDPMLRELDYTRMSREDQRFMNTNLYSF